MPKKKLSKSQIKSIGFTVITMVSLTLLTYYLTKKLHEDWMFITNILISAIGFMFLPLLYFVAKQFGFNLLKR